MTIASYEISLTATKRRRSSSQSKSSDSRSFYHLAAALAQHDEDSLACSILLESDYQDCLFSFQAQGKRERVRPNKSHLIKAINKFLVAKKITDSDQSIFPLSAHAPASVIIDQPVYGVSRDGVVYSPLEITSLLAWASSSCSSSLSNPNFHKTHNNLTAISFHQELTTMAHRPKHRAFWFCGSYESNHRDQIVERASLYSANRLIKKSWQVSHSVLPGIRYYHAALHSSFAEPLDVLYWLKLDENHQIIAGDFINEALTHRLYCPLEDLRLCALAQSGIYGELMQEIVEMYITSLGEK